MENVEVKTDIDKKQKKLSYVVEDGIKCLKCALSYRVLTPDGLLDGQNGAPQDEKEKVEQERTRVKKELFLEYYEKLMTISATCRKIDISDMQVRRWKVEDKEFAQKIINIDLNLNEAAVDVLKGKVFIEHDGPSVRYYLDRKHPEYKPKSVTEVMTPTKTLKQLIDEAEEELNKQNAGNNQQPETTDQPGDHPVDIKDKKQEGGTGAVLPKSCAEILLGKKDETKPDTQSTAKGN